MSDIKSKKQNLTPEEQVNLHLAFQGKDGIELNGHPEEDPSLYSLYEDDFRHFLEQGMASVSFAELSTGLLAKNEFFFDESDKPYRGWKLDKVTFTDDTCTPETIVLEFARFGGEKEERVTKPMTDLSDDDLFRIDNLVDEVNDHLAELNDLTEDTDDDDENDYDAYITDIEDKPVFGTVEYVQATHEVIGRKISEAYNEIAGMAEELELNDGDDNFGTVIPIDTVYDTLVDADRSNPEIYEYVAVSSLRKTGDMVVFGHRYAERNSRRRKTEQVMPLQATSVGALLGILGRLEEYLFDDDEEEDDEQ